MADSIYARALAWLGPNKAAIPEDDAAAPELGELVARSGETFIIPGQWLGIIAENTDKILSRSGGTGLDLYDGLLDDDVAFSSFQQRRLAVISREWEVAPGDDDDPRSVEAAAHLRDMLKTLSFDRICDKMLFAIWHGYAVAEGLYELGPDGKYRLADIVIPDRKHFGFTTEGELRFRPSFTVSSERLPPNRFWTLRTGASHDFAFYGLGLAHWCYWPIYFKRNAVRFWALYLEKLGFPTVVGEHQDTWTETEKKAFMAGLVGIGRDRAVAFAQGAVTNNGIQLMEPTRSSGSSSGFQDFVTEQNEALMRVILGQPGTSKATPGGIGTGQADSHDDVKAQIVKADADLLCESFNGTFPKWLTRWNFGDEVAPPRIYRVLDEPEDVDSIAERDVKLDGIGIKRTEDSIAEVYGSGYELVEPEPVPLALGGPPAPGVAVPGAANDDEGEREKLRAAFAAQDVAPLYVYRPLRNAAQLLKWARTQGIPNLIPADELHVTILSSKAPVDWFELTDGWAWESELLVPEGGARKVERFGDAGAIVVRFKSDDLHYSHRRKIERGASTDWPEFNPHVTVGFDPDGTVNLDAVEAYIGELKFGPEIFEELTTSGGSPHIRPVEFAAADEDAIARLATMLADETNPVFLEFGAALKEALAGVQSPEAARVALLEAFERMPAERMAIISGLPLVLERMAAEAGVEP